MQWENDPQFESYIVKEAQPGDGGWSLTFAEGTGIWCPSEHCQQEPQPGETARLYGKGFGYPVRGIAIGGRSYRYLTDEQEDARHAAWVEAQHAERQAKLDSERATRDATRAGLPALFRERIEGFIAARPHWRRDYESYELFVCTEAVKIADRFKGDGPAIGGFHGADSAAQKELVPDLDYSAHSGNTFGAACHLARLFIDAPQRVPLQHGALCPLVGCAEYGCSPARAKAAP